MDKTNLINLAEELLKKCTVCSVASVSEEGYPRICVLAQLRTDGIKTIYFSTGAGGTKVRHFKSNNKAGVTFYDGGDSVTLTGTMEIVADSNLKKELWEEWSSFLSNHMDGLDDPEFAVTKFTAIEATIYVNGIFETIKL